jgi:hypothetical protein
LSETKLAANALKQRVQFVDVRDSHDIEKAFHAANQQRAEAILKPRRRML